MAWKTKNNKKTIYKIALIKNIQQYEKNNHYEIHASRTATHDGRVSG